MYKPFENYHPSRSAIPYHIGIIPDGSRRWAKEHRTSYYEAYNLALGKLSVLINYIFGFGVSEISIYLASTQNFTRPQNELNELFRAVYTFLINIQDIIKIYSVNINYCGNEYLLPNDISNQMTILREMTKENVSKRLNICIAYNPLYEIWESAKKSSTPSDFLNNLWVKTPLDLVIRTGKANLISNFLILQSGFARMYFIDKLFNDIQISDIKQIMDTFKKNERKYGE